MVRLNKEFFLKLRDKAKNELLYGEFFNSDRFFFCSLIFIIFGILIYLKMSISNYYLCIDWNFEGVTVDMKHKFWYWISNEDFPQVEINSPWYTNALRAFMFEKLFYKNPFETLYDAIKGIFLIKQNWFTNFFVYKLFCEIMLCVQFAYLTVKYNAATSYVICIINYNAFRFWLEAIFNQITFAALDYHDYYNYNFPDARTTQTGRDQIRLCGGDYKNSFAKQFLAHQAEYLDDSLLQDADYVGYDKEIIFQGATSKGGPGLTGALWELRHSNSPYRFGNAKFPIFEDHSSLIEPLLPYTPRSNSGRSVWNKHFEEILRNMDEVNGDFRDLCIHDLEEDSFHMDFETFPYESLYSNPNEIIFQLVHNKVIEFLRSFIQLRVVIKDDHIEYINFYKDPLSLALTSNGLYKQDNLIGLSHFVGYEIILKGLFATLSYMADTYLSMFLFQSFNRRLKDFMPYLIRWHWTTHFLCQMLYQQIFLVLCITLQTWLHDEYQVYVEELFLKKDPNAELQMLLYASLDTLVTGLQTLYVPFAMFAGLHAIFGQYFYLPGITSHVELHIGRREDNSVFAGGSMDWQKYAYADRKFMWYGMLGRGRDKRFILFSFFDFIKNLLIKFFKKFILFLKRD